MNKRNCLGKEMKVNWATTSGGHQAKLDSNSSFSKLEKNFDYEMDFKLF